MLCTNPGLSRGQIALVDIPPVIYVDASDIQLLKNVQCDLHKDPFSLLQRPSEAIVDECQKLQRMKANSGGIVSDGDQAWSVRLGTLGIFTPESLDVLKMFCVADETKQKVRQELNWLSGVDDNDIREMLLSLRPSEEFLNIDGSFIDAKDFSNLACDRYVDGYTIDMSCRLFLKKRTQISTTAYLASHTLTWATAGYQFLNGKVAPLIEIQRIDTLEKFICPVHVDGCHWGILCIDFVQDIAYYDDGMHMEPPNNLSALVMILLNVLKSLFSLTSNLCHIDPLRFKRCGMPRQPNSGEGSSSCGIGVIFAARDIIAHGSAGIPSFNWSFDNSSMLRKQIMKELISFRSDTSSV